VPDVVLATLNARYIHTAFALRYLRANLGALRERSAIMEFDAQTRPLDVAEQLLALQPRILGLSVYIWNVTALTEVVRAIKQVAPHVVVVLGGPEVSHETEQQAIVAAADFVICGEGDVAFRELCEQVLAGKGPTAKVLRAPNPDLQSLSLPYDEYSDADIAHRIVYVEASRGCPFTCEFCLSALDERVRQFPLDAFLTSLQRLLDRGVHHFKFVDRTFNLNLTTSRSILEFFLARLRPGLFLHFELIPDRLPEPLRESIARFPAGVLQFEVGIQTFDETVAAGISRQQNNAKVETNLNWLRGHTGVHIHADLIVGLPGEDLATLGRGFDRLLALGPHEIQVGILKRLRGAPLARHDAHMRYAAATAPLRAVLRPGGEQRQLHRHRATAVAARQRVCAVPHLQRLALCADPRAARHRAAPARRAAVRLPGRPRQGAARRRRWCAVA
jgi:radical SAM superfamily enzyme YgiQ (UPF0313 family)